MSDETGWCKRTASWPSTASLWWWVHKWAKATGEREVDFFTKSVSCIFLLIAIWSSPSRVNLAAVLFESSTAGLIWFQLDNEHVKWWKRFLAVLLQNEDGLVEYFEAVLKATKRAPRNVIGWVTNELLSYLKQHDMSVSQRWDTDRHIPSTCFYISMYLFVLRFWFYSWSSDLRCHSTSRWLSFSIHKTTTIHMLHALPENVATFLPITRHKIF